MRRSKSRVAIEVFSIAVISLCMSFSQAQQAPATESPRNASVPRLVQFSGMVKDGAGRPVVGITFALYKEQESGAPIWMETQNVPLDESGWYSVLLGSTQTEGLPGELFASGEARWLGVQPEGQTEQARVLLLSVPYALKAADAETVRGLPPSAFVMAPHQGATPESATPAASSGTVTSVGLSAPTVDFTVTGSPVTTAGTLGLNWKLAPTSASTANAIAKRDAAGSVSAKQFISTALTGTPPFVVNSTTQVPKLNANLLGGLPHSAFATLGAIANSFSGSLLVGGNVGIATTSPTERLDLGNGGNVVIKTDPGSDTAEANVAYKLIGRDSGGGAHTWAIYTAPVGGGFGVPANSLSIWEYPSSGLPGCCLQRFVILPAGSGLSGSTVVVDGNGHLGIGTTTPSRPLEVSGPPGEVAEFDDGVRIDGGLTVVNNVIVGGCVSTGGGKLGNCTSDIRLKKNIQPFLPVLDKLVRLQPVSYNWRADEYPQFQFETSRTSGLIAQDVEKVFPEMVSEDKDGFKRVNYSELPYLMLEAIRDLKSENDHLRERIQRLEEVARH